MIIKVKCSLYSVVRTRVEQDVMEISIAAVHSDSKWEQEEIYLKGISWQRQTGLVYLFETLLSGMALGDTYLISQWTLSRMWEGSWQMFVFHKNSSYIL